MPVHRNPNAILQEVWSQCTAQPHCVCVKQLTKHPNLNLKLQTKCFVWSSDNGINDSHWVNKDASKDHFLKATDINFVHSATTMK